MAAPPPSSPAGWRFWIDRGGTFTDIVARTPDGAFTTAKLLSENPGRYRDAAVAGIRAAMGLGPDAPLPAGQIADVRIGTTIATNALLERKGARTLLVVNSGFADLLAIGRQTRPRLFDLAIRKPPPLHERTEEITGRVDVEGRILASLDEASAAAMFASARAEGLDACAIALIHAWRNPDMEQRLGALARDAGFAHVSMSHEVSPLAGLTARAGTTVIDAYLTPVLAAYVDQVRAALGDALAAATRLSFMQSSGGLASADAFRARNAVLSGPAGGVVGASRAAEAMGCPRIIAFDMGGTSTDVSLYDGRLERVFDAEIAGVELMTPMMAIETVAAGGGSILKFQDGRFRVGPASAGADPGPACYRRGGPLTVTDANVLLGKIQPDHFPAIFGPDGDQPLDRAVVEDMFARLAHDISSATGLALTPRETAEGFLRVAVANMAQAIRRITLEKGHKPSDFALQAFGGAASQHACLVADELGVETVLIHPMAGVLSAFGMGLADPSQMRRQAIEQALDAASLAAANAALDRLAQDAAASLDAGPVRTRRLVDLRYDGADAALTVDMPVDVTPLDALRSAFHAAHRQRFGFATPDRPLIIESVTVEATALGEPLPVVPARPTSGARPAPIHHVAAWLDGALHDAPVFERFSLCPSDRLDGPALIREANTTTIVEPGWRAVVGDQLELRLTRVTPWPRVDLAASGPPDPVMLELFGAQFMAAADRMGVVLRNTSASVNIKERLDFSCALFDAEGRLIANAPHVPVHLGAMGESVRAVLASRRATLKPGDMIALNNPYNGGTHLPDVTVIAPVFDPSGTTLRFFVGNRGHHADIGGMTPGSTPPDSTRLEQEGVVIDDFLLCDGGEFREDAFRRLLADAPWPARSPDTNVSDIKAQIAANLAGLREIEALVHRHGWPGVAAYMRHVMDNAEESVRRVIDRLRDGAFAMTLDDGSPLQVAVRVDHARREAVIDFTGTGPQRPGNFNAPPAVTRAAVLYVFRCLVADDLPLNEGCMRPLHIVIPPGSFLAPADGAAVVAGNTEVSQAICNVLLAALGASAASQGTMNNLLLGNAQRQYYETICGGAGAGPGFDGASAVHTHMTNTRITDPEILELRLPVRVETFAIRHESGGAGQYRGGDGALRRIRVLEPMTLSLVSSRRAEGPFGLAGGSPGAAGDQWIERADGSVDPLPGVAGADLEAGDAIVVATPGGGGHGG